MSRTLWSSILSIHGIARRAGESTDPRVSDSVGVAWARERSFPTSPRRCCGGWSGTPQNRCLRLMYQSARRHSCCLWEYPSFLLFLESTQCMGCGLIPSPHSSISVFNNNPMNQKCILLWKMLPPSNKCQMPQRLDHGLIFPFMKNSIKLLDVSVAAWRGHSDVQKTIEHASSGLCNVFRINGAGDVSGEMYFIQNVDGM